jgi:hypothetical protein
MNREQPVVARRRQTRAEVQRLVSEFFSSGMRQNEFLQRSWFQLEHVGSPSEEAAMQKQTFLP